MPQNPIQKAHLEGVEMFDEKFNYLYKLEVQGDWQEPVNMTEVRTFLTTYAEMILNGVKKAGPKKMTMRAALIAGSDAGAGYTIGHNSCIDDFRSAIDEGIKEIKKGDV